MAIDNLEIARGYVEAFNQHNADRCAAFAADDAKFTDMVSGREFDGPPGLREWDQMMFTAYPDGSVEILNAFGSSDGLVVEAVFRGTQRGTTPLLAIPPTGKKVELPFCIIGRTRDGKIVSARQYYDGLALLRQLGMAPSVAATPEARPQM